MNSFKLPMHLNAGGLLPFLTMMGRPLHDGGVEIDISELRRVLPASMVSLVAMVNLWRRKGREVRFTGISECPILSYLQRMDFLSSCGVEVPEAFRRHDSKGRFVPVKNVIHQTDEMAREVSACLAPGGEEFDHPNAGLFDMITYVLTEVGNNIRQHSSGTGYAAAQVHGHEGMIRMAFADNGMGILKSFRMVEAPCSEQATDAEAIARALEPRVSCKAGPPNEGVGLTMVSSVVSKIGGALLVVSGSGMAKFPIGGGSSFETFPEGASYQGTMVAMTFPERAAKRFADALKEAKDDAGILQSGRRRATFEP
jgi:ABC-type transporter Mla MlaB component